VTNPEKQAAIRSGTTAGRAKLSCKKVNAEPSICRERHALYDCYSVDCRLDENDT